MTLGFEVNKNTLDLKMAQTALQLRAVFEQVETIQAWLSNHPVIIGENGNSDPLTEDPFNYTDDEAYAFRLYFGTFDGIRTANAASFDIGRKLTGLE